MLSTSNPANIIAPHQLPVPPILNHNVKRYKGTTLKMHAQRGRSVAPVTTAINTVTPNIAIPR